MGENFEIQDLLTRNGVFFCVTSVFFVMERIFQKYKKKSLDSLISSFVISAFVYGYAYFMTNGFVFSHIPLILANAFMTACFMHNSNTATIKGFKQQVAHQQELIEELKKTNEQYCAQAQAQKVEPTIEKKEENNDDK